MLQNGVPVPQSYDVQKASFPPFLPLKQRRHATLQTRTPFSIVRTAKRIPYRFPARLAAGETFVRSSVQKNDAPIVKLLNGYFDGLPRTYAGMAMLVSIFNGVS